jgi:vacuolar-type H+-ATPase subunit H
VSPIVLALVTAGGVLVVGWVLLSGIRVVSQTRARRSAEIRRNERFQAERVRDQAEAILREAELKAVEILERAHGERESLLEKGLEVAERAALEMKEGAEQEAAAIVKDAELRAGEVLVEVERARARLEQDMQELAREQARVAAKQDRLSEFLLAALEEIERASPNGSARVGGLQELRDELRSTEERIDG